MKNVILNCVTPFATHLPSLALSILKSWLAEHEIASTIIYWNLHFLNLHNDFVLNDPDTFGNSHSLALLVNYIAMKDGSKTLKESFEMVQQGDHPRFIGNDVEYYEEHMRKFSEKMDEMIENILSSVNFSEICYFGFSAKMDTWLMSSIIAKKIKEKSPKTPIIIGGVANKKEAEAFLSSFSQFDIAIWGEGETPLLQLLNCIDKNQNLEYVSNIAYRDPNFNIIFSKRHNKDFMDLSIKNFYPDYDDYFSQLRELNINQNVVLPIEGSRGCHWNRCKFCYLNTDYKYRQKSSGKICEEIKYMMERYQIYSFEFLDNDFLGADLHVANRLLDSLIELKKNEPRFNIVVVEIITKGLNYDTIKKIFKAGVLYAQIGYENVSDSLLRKIDKKNTFASNLFYIKISLASDIPMYRVNNIINMPDETTEDIIEAISNLKFQRFFLHYLNFSHTLVQLHVNSSSRYYSKIKNEKALWRFSEIAYFFMKTLIEEKYWWDIFSFMKETEHFLWRSFRKIEKFYINNRFSYSISSKDGIFRYSEYINGRKTNELEFEIDSIQYLILSTTNRGIASLSDFVKTSYTEESIIEAIEDLYTKGLVYRNLDYSEIISVVNIENS